jgi:hypothetical protein
VLPALQLPAVRPVPAANQAGADALFINLDVSRRRRLRSCLGSLELLEFGILEDAGMALDIDTGPVELVEQFLVVNPQLFGQVANTNL